MDYLTNKKSGTSNETIAANEANEKAKINVKKQKKVRRKLFSSKKKQKCDFKRSLVKLAHKITEEKGESTRDILGKQPFVKLQRLSLVDATGYDADESDQLTPHIPTKQCIQKSGQEVAETTTIQSLVLGDETTLQQANIFDKHGGKINKENKGNDLLSEYDRTKESTDDIASLDDCGTADALDSNTLLLDSNHFVNRTTEEIDVENENNMFGENMTSSLFNSSQEHERIDFQPDGHTQPSDPVIQDLINEKIPEMGSYELFSDETEDNAEASMDFQEQDGSIELADGVVSQAESSLDTVSLGPIQRLIDRPTNPQNCCDIGESVNDESGYLPSDGEESFEEHAGDENYAEQIQMNTNSFLSDGLQEHEKIDFQSDVNTQPSDPVIQDLRNEKNPAMGSNGPFSDETENNAEANMDFQEQDDSIELADGVVSQAESSLDTVSVGPILRPIYRLTKSYCNHDEPIEPYSADESEYVPSDDESFEGYVSDEENEDQLQTEREALSDRSAKKKKNSRHFSKNRSSNISDTSLKSLHVPDDENMFVQQSDGTRGRGKRTFCMYCKKFQTKFARHLEAVHGNVDDVRKFSCLQKGSTERKQIIETLRKRCQFFFNTNPNFNDGELIVCRRPNIKVRRTAKDFVACPNCKGFFTKNNIRHHAQQCYANIDEKTRSVMVMGRKIVGRIHSEACDALKNKVFPIMKEDKTVRRIRYDRLVILYGNKMCCKYRSQHHHDMIRANLRLLGRFLCALDKIKSDVRELAELYDPQHYDATLSGINVVGGFDEETGMYKAPSTAYNLGSLIKKIGHLYISDCIKRKEQVRKQTAEDFLKLLVEDITVSVNKVVVESQATEKRRTKVELPTTKDIQVLHSYLENKRDTAYKSLMEKFSYDSWSNLAQTTLISVQLFNRRRPGEIERVFIEDFQSYESIQSDLLNSLPNNLKEAANKYVRFVIRGKLNRNVPVLLPLKLLNAIKLILKYREEARVSKKNRYVFGIPSTDKIRLRYLRAYVLIRQFAFESGANFPENLRGTKLRKHIATNCINLDLSESEINDVANYMGHSTKIHRDHYRQPIVSREILRMSRILEKAQGCRSGEESESSEGSGDNNQQGASSTPMTSTSSSSLIKCNQPTPPENNQNIVPKKAKKRPKIRCTSPFQKVKSKKRWTQEENDIAHMLFKDNIETGKFPSLKMIQQATRPYECLAKRSPPVIKTWISNKIKKLNK